MNTMKPLIEVMDVLQQRGYKHQFSLKPDFLHCTENGISLCPDDFEVDRFYRFEGMSDPSDNMILYAISSEKFGLKGQLLNAYGVDSDPVSAALVEKLALHRPRANV